MADFEFPPEELAKMLEGVPCVASEALAPDKETAALLQAAFPQDHGKEPNTLEETPAPHEEHLSSEDSVLQRQPEDDLPSLLQWQ